jgi:hypothetical protein
MPNKPAAKTPKPAAKTKATKPSKTHAKGKSTPSSTTRSLTPAQTAFVVALPPVSDIEVAHSRKVPADIALAFNADVIAAIHDNLALGGPDRATRITTLLAQQGKLAAVNEVLAPMLALVTNNLLAVNAELGDDIYEALKVATALEKTQPELVRSMKTADDWSKSHHAAHHAKAKPAQIKANATT